LSATANAQPSTAPLTLQDALAQARTNSSLFRTAQLTADLALEDKKQARAALLPSLSAFSQFIGTQENGTPSGVFVANDGPKIYNDWLTVHGEVSLGRWSEYRGAAAAAAVARARADVAARGLVSTIVTNYYTLVAAERKLTSAQQSLREAQRLLDITERQEAGGEVAHSDVVKARIQVNQRMRELQEAELAVLRSRLGLSVLVYADYRAEFSIVDDLQNMVPLPALATLTTTAVASSPEVRAAQASVQQESFAIGTARAEVLPALSFDYFYGINANLHGDCLPCALWRCAYGEHFL
jgi:outer membrane protein TolC